MTCCVCHKALPPRAIKEQDPFCSSECCRAFHHAPIREIPDWRTEKGYVANDVKYHRQKAHVTQCRVHLSRRHFLTPGML